MPDEKYKNTPLWYKHNLVEPSNTWLKGAKWTLKSGVLGAKSRKLGEQNNGMANKIERQNGAKCRGYPKK